MSANLVQNQVDVINDRKITLKPRKKNVRNALAGGFAGAFAKTCVAPIERVKLIMQLQNSIETRGVTTYNSRALSIMRYIYIEQGVGAFWRGNAANVLRQGGSAAMNFMLMDLYKASVTPMLDVTLSVPSWRNEEKRRKRRSIISSFLSGGLAGGTATTVLYPIEFLRTRLALDNGTTRLTRQYPNGMRDVLYSTLRVDGLKGLYQGYGIALGGVVLYRALHLGGYDALKTHLNYSSSHNQISITQRFFIAQIVSIVAGTICYPIDSVRRRLMMQAGQKLSHRKYVNSYDCFRKIWCSEGIKGFYLGIGPNLLRSVGGALLLVSYDVFKGKIC